MALNSASLEKTGAWYGFLNGLCLIAYALFLQFLNLVEVPILRFGFIIISVIFICLSISSLKKGRDGKLNYLPGIGVGAVTSIVATLIFDFFTIINILYFNSKIMDIIRSENLMGEHITIPSVSMVITMIGFAGGTITSFIAMQYFKRTDHKVPHH